MKLSVVISAFNEEKKISDCLASVAWADEIILIDGQSTDKTAEIAKKFGAKVYTRENNLMLNVNKNFGFTKAENEWILSIDADERVTPELREEIEKITKSSLPPLLKGDGGFSGFWIPRKNIIFGKWIQHTGWYPDQQLRLFKKDHGRFEEKHVHEMIKLQGEVGHLKNPMLHYNYETISQFLYKTTAIYAPNEAEQKLKNGYVFNYVDCVRFPVNEFLKRFFADEGFKDGFHGLMLSMLMAFYHFLVFAYIWEKKKFSEQENINITGELKKELRKSGKDLNYWFNTKKIEQEKNILKKAGLKLKRKINL